MTNNNVTAARNKMLPGWLIVLGALTAIGPLSIDMYLPSFPTIANNLSVGSNLVQLTLASFLVGLAVGQMFYGPLSDRFGRKPPLYFGLGLYTLASIACLFAPDVTTLIFARFLQGLGGCAGMVIARAVIRDRMGAAGSARAFSLLMLVMGLAPILAPLIELHGIKPENFGWVFGANAFGLIAASQINVRLVGKLSSDTILGRALWLPAGLALAITLLVAGGVDNLPLLLVGFFGFLACYGFISPNASAIALSQQGRQAGTASALMGTLQFCLGILAGVSMSLWHDATALPLMTVMTICGGGALLLHRYVARPEHKRLMAAAKP